jgi:hypothetical protein
MGWEERFEEKAEIILCVGCAVILSVLSQKSAPPCLVTITR